MEKTAWRTGEKGENQREQCQRGFDEEETSDLKGESREGNRFDEEETSDLKGESREGNLGISNERSAATQEKLVLNIVRTFGTGSKLASMNFLECP